MDIYSRHSQILDFAERIVRKRGYNGFSYADVAKHLGISKASVHHHFATKSDLGLALIARFEDNVLAALDVIDKDYSNSLDKLREYASIFEGSYQENQMCLCGMLAAEHETLSDNMQSAIVSFFEVNEEWLEKVLIDGKKLGEIDYRGSAQDQARNIIANLQGALMVAKSMNSFERMSSASRNLVNSFKPHSKN